MTGGTPERNGSRERREPYPTWDMFGKSSSLKGDMYGYVSCLGGYQFHLQPSVWWRIPQGFEAWPLEAERPNNFKGKCFVPSMLNTLPGSSHFGCCMLNYEKQVLQRCIIRKCPTDLSKFDFKKMSSERWMTKDRSTIGRDVEGQIPWRSQNQDERPDTNSILKSFARSSWKICVTWRSAKRRLWTYVGWRTINIELLMLLGFLRESLSLTSEIRLTCWACLLLSFCWSFQVCLKFVFGQFPSRYLSDGHQGTILFLLTDSVPISFSMAVET